MKILVCFKILPNPDRVLTEDWDNFSLSTDLRYAGMDFNCFDQSALELGLQIRDQMAVQGAEASCTAVTVSDTMPETLFSNLYAVGYDRVLCIPDKYREFRPRKIASLLADVAEQEKPDLILTGTQAGLSQTGMVPYFMASRLHLPLLGEVEQLCWSGDGLTARSRGPEGLVERKTALPVICAVGNSPEVLRFAGLRERMLCRSKKAELLPEVTDYGNYPDPKLTRPDTGRSCTLLDGSDPAGRTELMARLRKAAGTGGERKNGADGLSQEERDFLNRHGLKFRPPLNRKGDPAELADIFEREQPHVMLLPDDEQGRTLCTALADELQISCFFGGRLTQLHPRYATVQKRVCASNLEWTEYLPLPTVLTLTPEEWARFDGVREAAVPESGPELCPGVLVEPARAGMLRSADLVIICGCGMKNRENVDRARLLAEKLGAGFGLTRPAALNGWGSTAEIVGQSGSVLAPRCVLTLGAAGAGAFLAGIEHAETIIAVNTDPEALIFKNADLGLEADAPALTEALLNLC